MKIVIPGGGGQVGTILARAFHGDGHDVVILSRRHLVRPWRVVQWDGMTRGQWTRELEGCDALINLAGRSVNCRYTEKNRRAILESRIGPTRAIGEAIARAARPPVVWMQASTATIYTHTYDAPNDERSGAIGGSEPGAPSSWAFSIDVARAWEAAFDAARVPHTRKVTLRSAMTMSPDEGGVFDTLLTLARCGLGGPAAGGRQYVSWIHDWDFVEAARWLIAHDDIDGIVNVAAPNPLPHAAFMQALRIAAGVPFGLPATRWMLEIGALLMRTETELLLKSRRVIPGRLLERGFVFRYPVWQDAALHLCRRRQQRDGRQAA